MMSDPLDDLLDGLEGLEDPEFLAEAAGVAREVTESLALDLRASIPYVPSGPVIIRSAAAAPPVAKVKVTAVERAAIAAEKARIKVEKEATKAAATTAALLAALKEIRVLKAFIRASGLKVPS